MDCTSLATFTSGAKLNFDEEKDEFEELIKKYVRGEVKRQLNAELTVAGLKKDEQPSQASSS